jgi:hypothetical protein
MGFVPLWFHSALLVSSGYPSVSRPACDLGKALVNGGIRKVVDPFKGERAVERCRLIAPLPMFLNRLKADPKSTEVGKNDGLT